MQPGDVLRQVVGVIVQLYQHAIGTQVAGNAVSEGDGEGSLLHAVGHGTGVSVVVTGAKE